MLFNTIRNHGLVGAVRRAPKKILRIFRKAYYDYYGITSALTDYGVLMNADWNDSTFRMCFRAEFGWFLFDQLSKRRSNFVFLDIGSNQGLYALIAAKNPFCQHVIALEPVPKTANILRRNVLLNNRASKTSIIEAALSDRDGYGDISITEGDSGVASLNHELVGGLATLIKLISINSLHAILSEYELPVLVKIDVEGHEQTVIEQIILSDWIGRVDWVFYEIDERWTSFALTRSVLESAGFNRFLKVGKSTSHYDVFAVR